MEKDYWMSRSHDREEFKEPPGWQTIPIAESPVLIDFENIWNHLAPIYEKELSALAYALIPMSDSVFSSVRKVLDLFK